MYRLLSDIVHLLRCRCQLCIARVLPPCSAAMVATKLGGAAQHDIDVAGDHADAFIGFWGLVAHYLAPAHACASWGAVYIVIVWLVNPIVWSARRTESMLLYSRVCSVLAFTTTAGATPTRLKKTVIVCLPVSVASRLISTRASSPDSYRSLACASVIVLMIFFGC